MDNYTELISKLNDSDYNVRINAAALIGQAIKDNKLTRISLHQINNHIHTKYSFSPYEPAMAAFLAWQAGNDVVGSVDHDSIFAAKELHEASEMFNIAATSGIELRINMKNTPFYNRKLNCPDAEGIAYFCIHAIPKKYYDSCDSFLKPIRQERSNRNRLMVDKLNTYLPDITIDYDRDIIPVSKYNCGGTITERHILYGLSKAIVEKTGKGNTLISYLNNTLKITVSPQISELLLDVNNEHYLYDLLGLLKGYYLPLFYILPGEKECPLLEEFFDFADSINGISAYPYLGDVKDSPTMDKKPEAFEDSYLNELVEFLAEKKCKAITYMPPRNTKAQLLYLKSLCEKYGFMQISGVDVNSSRQKLNCDELNDPDFAHLYDSAFALVEHEKM